MTNTEASTRPARHALIDIFGLDRFSYAADTDDLGNPDEAQAARLITHRSGEDVCVRLEESEYAGRYLIIDADSEDQIGTLNLFTL